MSSTVPQGGDTATALFSRDFDALETGEGFVTPGRTITEADVVSFAGLTGDFHPQHVDEEWARQSQFGERLAHGMLVLSVAVGLVPLDPERVLALRRISDAVFKRPTRLGDTVRVEGKVESLREIDEETGLVGCTWKVVGPEDAVIARVKVEVLWRRGELGAAEPAASDDAESAADAPDPSSGLPL
ncbi:MAG: MaoC family dehydratase N-terminal domain-containing protein [Thermoleophilaceae bacterium]|jgi:acyl dehydratase|nr:MaoC family dehydratase N-terminal domain-containing protein [Thermoleophilaceae bacterium]